MLGNHLRKLSSQNYKFQIHLQDHAGFTVGDAGHDEAWAVAEGDVLGERQSLEMFRLPGSFRNANFLHCLGKVLPEIINVQTLQDKSLFIVELLPTFG